MRNTEELGLIHLRHFEDENGEKVKFSKTVEVRCPMVWLEHPRSKDIIDSMRDIIVQNWHDFAENLYFNVCGIRTRRIAHSAWEYWFSIVDNDDSDNDDDDDAASDSATVPQNSTACHDTSTSSLKDQGADHGECTAPTPLTDQDYHIDESMSFPINIESEIKKEVDSEAETVIVPINPQPSGIIKEEVDISDCETYFNPNATDDSEEQRLHEVSQGNLFINELSEPAPMVDELKQEIQMENNAEDPFAEIYKVELAEDFYGAEETVGEGYTNMEEGVAESSVALMGGDAACDDDEPMMVAEVVGDHWEQLSNCSGEEVYYRGMIMIL